MGIYHPCGAMLVEEADGVGIYTKSGHYRVSLDSPGHGVYDSTGARRMTDTTGQSGFVGKYAKDGSWNVTIVDGSQRTGLWAPNGSLNVVLLSSFDPSILFSNGEQGGWYDPSDLTTLFQDAAGTVPVTAVGQPVGRMLDKSGNGNHLVQPATASRPTYRTDGTSHWLEFDGVDDFLSTTAAFDLSSSDKLTVMSGAHKVAPTETQVIAELGGNAANTVGSFWLVINHSSHRRWGAFSRGGVNPGSAGAAHDTTPSPDTAVITCLHDIDASLSRIRRNGVFGVDATANKGSGNFSGINLLFIGCRNGTSLPFSGNIYSLIIRSGLTEGADLTNAEAWLAAKTGVTL